MSLAEIKNAVEELSPKELAELVAFLRGRETVVEDDVPLHVRSLAGHRVLAPLIAQSELADEFFGAR